MFESKLSSARSSWGEMSSINHTNAPGFVPIPCPTHTEYSITNICKAPNCIEPLCPQCIADHVQLHQQTKKPAKIENIVSTRLKCIEQLAKMKFEGQTEIEEYVKNSSGNLEQFVEAHQRRLETAQKKVQKLVDQMFSEMQKQMEVIMNAYHLEKEKKDKEARVKLSPLNQFVAKVSDYKQELESEDYIPALIELLNEPPKKPKIEHVSSPNNYGEVEINEKKFADIRQSIEKFVKVIVNCKDEGKVNLNRSNYHSSNNMKFSRFQRSRSKQFSRDNSASRLDQSRRSNSKKKIFGGDSIISQIHPITQGVNKVGEVSFSNEQGSLKVKKPSYFMVKNCSIAYFKQKSKFLFMTNLEYPESGFEKVLLEIPFTIPEYHRTIHTPNGRIFLLGGQEADSVSQKCYELANKNTLREMQAMNIGRAKFAACFANDFIFVMGGLIAPEHLGWGHRKATNSCQRFSLRDNRWEKVAPLPEPAFAMEICALEDKIVRVGGLLENGQILKRIDIYSLRNNQWMSVQTDPRIVITSKCGLTQISRNEIAIFGGLDERGDKTSSCYVLSDQHGSLKVTPGVELYNEASFQSSYVFDGAIFAIQDSDSNRSKLLMGYRHDQWKFVSC